MQLKNLWGFATAGVVLFTGRLPSLETREQALQAGQRALEAKQIRNYLPAVQLKSRWFGSQQG